MLPEIDLTHVALETPRLILRAPNMGDLNDFFAYASVPGVGEMAGWPHHKEIADSRRILEMFIVEKNIFAVCDRETGKMIGTVGIHDTWMNRAEEYASQRNAEIGYVLSKAYWGRGLMPEAVKEVMRYGFHALLLDHIGICCFTTNPQSKRVIEKCGLAFYGMGEYYSKQLNERFDEYRYVMARPK